MKPTWTITRQKSRPADGVVLIRWIVHQTDATRGICECWKEEDAAKIAGALNAVETK